LVSKNSEQVLHFLYAPEVAAIVDASFGSYSDLFPLQRWHQELE